MKKSKKRVTTNWANTTTNVTTTILISRQRLRCIFQDSIFVLSPLSHIFVRLQDWDTKAPSPWIGPAPAWPPYDVEPGKIKKYYLEQGAEFVQLHMVSDPELKKWRQAIGEKAKLPKYHSKKQYASNVNMLILRHLVYQDMLRSETERGMRYEQSIYLREDSVFVPFGNAITPRVLPQEVATLCPSSLDADSCVVSTALCGYQGMYDKMFYANAHGAGVLFGKAHEDFFRAMQFWLSGMKHTGGEKRNLKTELFYEERLGKHRVRTRRGEFERMNMRYIGELRRGIVQNIRNLRERFAF